MQQSHNPRHLDYGDSFPTRKGKGQKSLTPSGRLEKVFSGRQLDFLFIGRHLQFSTLMPQDAVRLSGKKWDAKRSHPEPVSSSVPRVKEQTNVKRSNSLKANPTTRVENSLSMVDKMKPIVM